MRFRCRIGWHDWSMWSQAQLTLGDLAKVTGEVAGMRRHCWCCGWMQVKELKKQ